MPELPEVQTIISQLSDYLPLKVLKISKSEPKKLKNILHTDIPDLKNISINSIDRHGKCLIFNFSNKTYLLSHLGMTGTWRISKIPLSEKHVHFSFIAKEKHLSYVDSRRFGHMYFFTKEELDQYLKRLGEDLRSPNFTIQYISHFIKKYPNRIIKNFLLEQKFFAGSGNYIANEVCALSKILPTRLNTTLSESDIKKIHQSFDLILSKSIESSGVTFQGGYQDAFGEKGKGVSNLVVFHQKICGMCKKENIKKIYIKKRGTFYCPQCQK